MRPKENQTMSKLEFAKYLVNTGRFNEQLDQSYTIPTDPDKEATVREAELLLKLSHPLIIRRETPIIPLISVEQQKDLKRIHILKESVINKLLCDKKTMRPDRLVYQREININRGRLRLDYFIDEPSGFYNLKIAFDKKRPFEKPLQYELINSAFNQNPIAPESIQGIENLMNLYLQADTGRFAIFRKIAGRLFHFLK